ncbi:hypothetical protein B5X24_HaOG211567 [Helicoverpa armigera]|nr:hypothetical protein B5X24_HaOG211567 [Helicoverpa armigera]
MARRYITPLYLYWAKFYRHGRLSPLTASSGAKSETLGFHQRPYFPAGAEFSRRPEPVGISTRLCTQTLALDEVELCTLVPLHANIFTHFYSLRCGFCSATLEIFRSRFMFQAES